MARTVEEAGAIFNQLAKLAAAENGSDIFINSFSHPAIKKDGRLHYVTDVWLDDQDLHAMLKSQISEPLYQRFIKENELNLMVEVQDVSYFRVNVYQQKGLAGMVLRLIPTRIPTMEELLLPDILKKISLRRRGLVIVTGATGSGKSTTLASMIDYRNQNSQCHIITVEDPIEFMHQSKRCVVIQREVGVDTESYGSALKNSLRQAPDVILIGEIRDADTMQYAMHFAETGHLCMATLHATNALQTLERIYNFFPRELRIQLQLELSNNLACIMTQRLIQREDGNGRVVALEMLSNTAYIRQLIRDGELEKIPEAMRRSNKSEGVVPFDDYLFSLYEKHLISYQSAIDNAESINDFRVRIRAESQRELPEELKIEETTSFSMEKIEEKKNAWGL